MSMHNDPHPMITPLAAIPPEEAAKSFADADMLDAYRIIWNNTLSYMSKQPVVREHRALFKSDAGLIAIGSRQMLHQGWLRFQSWVEAPESAVPEGAPDALALHGDLSVGSVEVESPAPGCAPDDLIGWLADNDLASPGTLSSILARMEQVGWIEWTEDRILSTPKGDAVLDALERAGMGGLSVESIQRFRALLDAHEYEGSPVQEAANALFSTLGLVLDEDVSWLNVLGELPSHAASDAYASVEADAVQPPRTFGYPPSIDPEIHLPADAPERAQRLAIEQALVQAHGEAWYAMPPALRVERRMERLAVLWQMDISTIQARARFDVLVRWRVGMDV